MGYYLYCSLCRIPIKAFDSGPLLLCGHDEYADESIFSTNTDDSKELDRWNKKSANLVDEDMSYCRKTNPYADNVKINLLNL